MDKESEISKIQFHLESIDLLLNNLLNQISVIVPERLAIDSDWVDQETIMKLTGLGKTKLYELRKQNKISYSTIGEKAIFYRLSDFAKLLNRNEKNR